MTGAISRAAGDPPELSPKGIDGRRDLLRQLPTEIRLMIYEELLVVWPKPLLRTGEGCCCLNEESEEEEDVKNQLSWRILLTCRTYFEEAAPILYGKNAFVLPAGPDDSPGPFWRFPVAIRYMPFLTAVSVQFHLDAPWSETSRRVAYFLGALSRHAVKLEHLAVAASAERCGSGNFAWHILSPAHPVAKQLVRLAERKPARELVVHVHEWALLPPRFAHFLTRRFRDAGGGEDRSLVFTRSCDCPKSCTDYHSAYCIRYGHRRRFDWGTAVPVELVVDTDDVEASVDEFVRCWCDLGERGSFCQDTAEDDDGDDEADEEEDARYPGPWPFQFPSRNVSDVARPAFEMGLRFMGKADPYDLSAYLEDGGGGPSASADKKRQTRLEEFFPKAGRAVDESWMM